ncbi:HlyD family secretion protein [Bacteroidota bacterium]
MKRFIILFASAFSLLACNRNHDISDAYGNFEATEITISSEAQGKLIDFKIEEGDILKRGDKIGLIDTTALHLRKEQLIARKEVIRNRLLNIPSQINVLKERKTNLLREKERLDNLKKDNAATQKQLDDMAGEIKVLDKELEAQNERLKTNNAGLAAELRPIDLQIEEMEDQIRKSMIINPVNGTVLVKYSEVDEIVTFAKPLYKIADLEYLHLRAFVSQIQMDDITVGGGVKVLIDKDEDSFHEYNGKITWISDKAEFTPKIVQTKEERVNLVYAIKVKVKNDGKIKIGMPGEIVIETK